MPIRQPVGIAGLIVPANTPIAYIAWKVFPAVVCGNTAVLKSAEDAPATAVLFAAIAHEAGLPAGVLNVVHGYGAEAGAALVAHPDVGVISFTGSTATGRRIQAAAADRLARVSLELGGKNPLVVCDDADLDRAVHWTALSAFSNAGQRCAAASRIIVDAAVYDEFRQRLLARVASLKVGPTDADDLGPVINARQLTNMLDALARGRSNGVTILAGGHRLEDRDRADGYYVAPTVLEGVPRDHELSSCELFGPITALYRVSGFQEALALAGDSPYGLTAAIHTRNLDRALVFVQRVPAGVVSVNGGTYGSEPHMPFGGVKQSGNGTREPGTEALDVYSQVKNVYLNAEPSRL
jgi:aldehyde dehydrogenase (NAD+)